jgi:osmotically-inducible protein OsmY
MIGRLSARKRRARIERSEALGRANLTGNVEYEPQREGAYEDVASLDGVTGISNRAQQDQP